MYISIIMMCIVYNDYSNPFKRKCCFGTERLDDETYGLITVLHLSWGKQNRLINKMFLCSSLNSSFVFTNRAAAEWTVTCFHRDLDVIDDLTCGIL